MVTACRYECIYMYIQLNMHIYIVHLGLINGPWNNNRQQKTWYKFSEMFKIKYILFENGLHNAK